MTQKGRSQSEHSDLDEVNVNISSYNKPPSLSRYSISVMAQ